MAKWRVAPGVSASTPGDFFWCATLVASDVLTWWRGRGSSTASAQGHPHVEEVAVTAVGLRRVVACAVVNQRTTGAFHHSIVCRLLIAERTGITAGPVRLVPEPGASRRATWAPRPSLPEGRA